MVKHQHVFERFATFENLFDGYKLARKGKRYKPEVLDYTFNLEENIIDSLNHLIYKDLKVEGLHTFYEYFPKKRIIHALPFKYRVLNCAAYNVLWPIYARSFYEHSYGSIPGKGQIRACCKLQEWMRLVERKPDKWYIGKLDIAKFFFRVPVDVQLRELGRPLDDPDMMWYLETMTRCGDKPFGLPLEVTEPSDTDLITGVGMQVGSLISQMAANVVLTPLDHYIKRVLRIPYYIRYMDDMVLLAPSREDVWEAIHAIDDYLQTYLGLQLNNKTVVQRAGRPIEFVGKVLSPDRIDLRKDTSLRMKQHLDYVRKAYANGEVPFEYAKSVIISYLGMLKYTSASSLRKKILHDYVLVQHRK